MKFFQLLAISFLAFTTVFSASYKYTFAQEWPGSICVLNTCKKEFVANYHGQQFSIHGLWPDINNAGTCQQISFCTKEAFDVSKLSADTKSKIDETWVGFYNSINDFRDHEWGKHGTCWQGQPLQSFLSTESKQDMYFQTVYHLSQKYNLLKEFSYFGILPSNSKIYSYQEIQYAILAAINKNNEVQGEENMFQLVCQKDSKSGKNLLVQVYLCLDDDYKPMSCDCVYQLEDQASSCGSGIALPTYNL